MGVSGMYMISGSGIHVCPSLGLEKWIRVRVRFRCFVRARCSVPVRCFVRVRVRVRVRVKG